MDNGAKWRRLICWSFVSIKRPPLVWKNMIDYSATLISRSAGSLRRAAAALTDGRTAGRTHRALINLTHTLTHTHAVGGRGPEINSRAKVESPSPSQNNNNNNSNNNNSNSNNNNNNSNNNNSNNNNAVTARGRKKETAQKKKTILFRSGRCFDWRSSFIPFFFTQQYRMISISFVLWFDFFLEHQRMTLPSFERFTFHGVLPSLKEGFT